MKYPPVPVIMYHNVGVLQEDWLWNHLTCPWELFEKHLMQLKKEKYCTVSLQELYDHMQNGTALPSRSIVLTFDDGYLDNWVFAYPLLKKHGFKGTIYVNPEFVDPREILRKNLFDVWNHGEDIERLKTRGFLSWQEMKIMEAESVMDIQSHSMSHTWYFCSDEIVDFHSPGKNDYPWLFWNVHPKRKSYYLAENQEEFVSYGSPVYHYGRSLGIRRYFEDNNLTNHLVSFVNEQGEDFFKENNWKSRLYRQVEIYKSNNKLSGRYETDEEQKKRFEYELKESKRILEEKLNKKVNFMCWAGGAFNDIALETADEAGYLSSTVYYCDVNRKNIFGEEPAQINRIGCVSSFSWRNRFISFTDSQYFLAHVKLFKGSRIYLWIMRLYKLKYIFKFTTKKILR